MNTECYHVEFIRLIRRRFQKINRSHFGQEKSALQPRQRTGLHLRSRYSQIGRIRLRIAAPTTEFSRFGPLRILFVSKPEKIAQWKEIRTRREKCIELKQC